MYPLIRRYLRRVDVVYQMCIRDSLTGVQVEMLIRELKKKHISAFGKYKIEY